MRNKNIKVSGSIVSYVEGNAGISPLNSGTITSCHNSVSVSTNSNGSGGICSCIMSGEIRNCYNTGNIYSQRYVGGISGASGDSSYPTAYTYNCYNLGSIKGTSFVGNITGELNFRAPSRVINCYGTNVTVDLLNSGSNSENMWKPDKTVKINNGYPILSWQ